MAPASVFEEPLVAFGPEIAGDLDTALRREWLVTNGLGGYASGTLAGIPSRRYHGLLVAATRPPGGRRVLVSGLVEWAVVGGVRFALHAFEYADGTIDKHGHRLLESFRLEGALPVWRYELAGCLLERRVWMAAGANAAEVRYEVVRGGPVDLEATPLLTDRDHHALAFEDAFDPLASAMGDGRVDVLMRPQGTPISLVGAGAEFALGGVWYRGMCHREEAARGLDSLSDAWAPGTFRVRLERGRPWTLIASTAGEPVQGVADPELGLAAARRRQAKVLHDAHASALPRPIQQLVLAADQFIVARESGGRTVIAGYHWFADWGRDTMIALPGLTLATGRARDGSEILRTFARLVRDGLLPNNLPEDGSLAAGYNTVDAALWFIHALRSHAAAAADGPGLVRELLPTVLDIIEAHLAGTLFGIGFDPADGLLRAGEPGQQLTWMDARVGDREITPRIGKPVEINALWLNALDAVVGWLDTGDPRRARLEETLRQGRESFVGRFWLPESGHLADVVDGPDGDDPTLRPNQILALSLPLTLLDDVSARSVLDIVESRLLAPLGLRSFDPQDPRYAGAYGGDPGARDGTYHQGTVWTWLMGPYVDAVARYRSRAEALMLIEPFAHHLLDAGLGSVSEILDGDPPHHPRGAIAQAWGVAEILRVWRGLLVEPSA